MDPDADYHQPNDHQASANSSSRSRNNRSGNYHRDVSQEEALPNSSRRAANRRTQRGGGGGGSEYNDDGGGGSRQHHPSSSSRTSASVKSSTPRYKSREERSATSSAVGSMAGPAPYSAKESRHHRHHHPGSNSVTSGRSKQSKRHDRNHNRNLDSDNNSDKESRVSSRKEKTSSSSRRRERHGDERSHRSDGRKHQPSTSSSYASRRDTDSYIDSGSDYDSDGTSKISSSLGGSLMSRSMVSGSAISRSNPHGREHKTHQHREEQPFELDHDDDTMGNNIMENIDEGSYDDDDGTEPTDAHFIEGSGDFDEYTEFESIEGMSYNEHCGDTTYYTKSVKSHKTQQSNYKADSNDSELDQLHKGDAPAKLSSRESQPRKQKEEARHHGSRDEQRHSSSSRERVNSGTGVGGGGTGDSPKLLHRKVPPPPENDDVHAVGHAAAGGEDANLEPVVARKPSSDPPTAREFRNPTSSRSNHRSDRSDCTPTSPPKGSVDPQFDDSKSLMSRLNAPPSPAGPERNKRAVVARDPTAVAGRSNNRGGGYSNYMLDEEGIRQYNQKQQQQQYSPWDNDEDVDSGMFPRSVRGQDPPEAGRGSDPKQIGSADPPEADGKTYRSTSGKNRGGGRRHMGKSRKEDAPASSSEKKKDLEKRHKKKSPSQPEIKGILKKKGAPIPITQFGQPVNNNAPPPPMESDDEDSSATGGSDPEVTEEKQRAAPLFQLDNNDEDGTVKSQGTKSGLRSGKYASLNVAAAKQYDDEEDNFDDGGTREYESEVSGDYTNDDDYTNYTDNYTVDTFNENNETYNSKNTNHINDNSINSDDSDDDNTLKSIKSTADDRYDRSKANFMRTADLGLTQDTIFAEQFLDDPNSRPEPHYHHPSPHPPPGVQFHIDENWVCLDDGKGSHSPIAPQAVDALVAMGFRAACDPMMWTPTSKTRKYMTEKGLRFDDVPIPGPLEEGEGGPGDSTCLVWSGKFAHKYHGHEQPAVRSQGIVNMSPEELVDLIMDSKRVSEYNKSSIGRTDEVVLSDGTDLDNSPFSGQRKKKLTGVVMQGATVIDGNAVFESETDDEQSELEEIEEVVFDDDGHKSVHTITLSSRRERRTRFVGETKLVRTTNKPPLVRKVLEFYTLLHCRALTDDQGGDGFIIVGRGITPASDADKKKSKKGVMHSEILLNVHIIRRLRDSKRRREKGSRKGGRNSKNVSTSARKASKGDLANRCLMINVNHLKSPMVPNMLAKKVGLSAALNFIMDIRGLTE